MGKEILTFGNIEIEKNRFYPLKTPFFIYLFIYLFIFGGDVHIEKIFVSNKISFGEKIYKYFIGYLHNGNKIKPLDIMLPKTSAYVKSYDGQTK